MVPVTGNRAVGGCVPTPSMVTDDAQRASAGLGPAGHAGRRGA
jgi:hypothetical protein